jgi:hypothetical protein
VQVFNHLKFNSHEKNIFIHNYFIRVYRAEQLQRRGVQRKIRQPDHGIVCIGGKTVHRFYRYQRKAYICRRHALLLL